MLPLMTDARFNSVALILVAVITIAGTVISTILTRQAKNTAAEARDNSQEAKESAGKAWKEVQTNGGMEDPNPNINDHIKYQTQMMETVLPLVQMVVPLGEKLDEHIAQTAPMVMKLNHVDDTLAEHLKHSQVMDKALSQVYLVVRQEHPDALPTEEDEV